MRAGVTANESMDDRIKEFRSDPHKMDVTTKFVDEVVEKAKDEVLRRLKEKEAVQQKNFDFEDELPKRPAVPSRLPGRGRSLPVPGSTRKRGRWHSRARGFFARMFSSLCLCSPETKV